MCNLKCNNSTQRRVFKLGKSFEKKLEEKNSIFFFRGKKVENSIYLSPCTCWSPIQLGDTDCVYTAI